MKKVKRDKASAKEAYLTQKSLNLRREAESLTTKETAEQNKERQQARKRRHDYSMEDLECNRMLRAQLDEKRSQGCLANDLRAQ